MAFGLFKGKDESADDAVARKDYGKAAQILRGQLKGNPRDVRIRQQLADVLVLADKGNEAVDILLKLSDEFASDGFVAKSIAVLKKIQKIDPKRSEVESKLASLIEDKEKEVSTGKFRPLAPQVEADSGAEFDSEEIGFELSDDELPANAPAPRKTTRKTVVQASSEGSQPAAPSPLPSPSIEVPSESTAPPAVGEETLTEHPGDSTSIRRKKGEERRWREIAATPLFTDFTKDELIAVIRGMQLRSFQEGDIVVTEKEPGDSLFIITTGTVKVFTMNPFGQHVHLADLVDGDFFGEVSVLTGKPRTATITAKSKCEVLELTKPTLDGIAAAHPHVREVLDEFYKQRVNKTVEAMISSLKK